MNLNVNSLVIWLSLIALAFGIANTVWVWLRTSSGDVKTKIKALSDKIEAEFTKVTDNLKGHDRRIQAVESEVKHLPTKDDFNELKVQMTALAGTVEGHSSELKAVGRTADRIEGILMGGGKA